jgi:GT2 family glycosyltransferase
VPFHTDLLSLERCLAALSPLPPDSELIIAADGATEDCRPLAALHRATVVSIPGPSGPASARNAAAALASGDVLVFVDSDVEVSRSGLERVRRVLVEQPDVAAAFGSYDDRPGDPGFISQYKNLSHSYIHHASAAAARTFWTGFGAVRREAFERVGGFDERLRAVEDIDFGYRLAEAGYAVMLDTGLSACHLKRWTVRSMVLSDMRDRGIPWMQLILRYGALSDDLNLRTEYRWSIGLAYVAMLSVVLAFFEPRWLLTAMLAGAALTALNHSYYRFFYRKRGAAFAARAWLLHTVQHLCNGLSFVIGLALFVFARYVGLRLPGALAVDPWNADFPRVTPYPRGASAWSADPAGP